MYGSKYKIIYPALEAWMRASRVSISRLAEMSGVSGTTMQNYVYGRHDPRLSLCRRLVEITGIPFEELFNEK